MLQSLHSSSSSFFIKVLFGLLVASFALWGIGDIFRSGGSTTVVKVGNTTVSAPEFNGELQRALQEYRKMLGKDYSNELALSLGIPQMVLSRLVEQKLVEQEAKSLGIIISDNILMDVLRKTPAFQNAKGQFDAQQFRRVLQQNGLSEKQYMDLLRKEISADLLMQTTLSGVAVPEVAAKQAFLAEHETRLIDMMVLNRALAQVPAPTDAELERFYQQNTHRYQRPEKRRFSVLTLNAEQITAAYTPSEEELHTAFEAHKNELSTPEKRKVSQLLYTSEQDAQKAYDLLKQGKSLADVAKEVKPVNNDLSLGDVAFGQLASEVAQDVFQLAENSYSTPLQTNFGWHVFYVHSITPAQEASFDSARGQLLRDLKESKASELAFQLSNEVHDSLASGATFEDVAARYGARVEHFGPVTVNEELAAAIAPLRERAFALQAGETTPLAEAEGNTLQAITVEEIIPADVKPLAEVKNAAVADWTREQQAEKLKTIAKEAAEKVGASSFAQTAKELGADYLAKQPVKRDTSKIGNAEVTAPFMAMVFNLPLNTLSEAAPVMGEKYALVEVKAVEHPALDSAEAKQGIENAHINLRSVYIDEYYKQYMQYLMTKHAVSEPNMALINAMMQ